MHLPANDVFTVSISRIRGEVTNDVEVGFSSDHFGGERLPRASENLHGSRADPPVQLEGTHTQVDGV